MTDYPEVQMSDTEHYRKVYADHPGTPCVVEGCRLSQQEHHRTHYFNAAQRLQNENWHLLSAVAEIRERMGDADGYGADIEEILVKWGV